MTPRVSLIVSIDTEEDNWTPASSGWSIDNIRELPAVARRLAERGLKVTYFTTYPVADSPWAMDVLRRVVADYGGEIAAHVHPWNTPPLDPQPRPGSTMLRNLPLEVQRAKVQTLADRIDGSIGIRPTAFRAGRFGLGPETVGVLADCGFIVDSSVTPFFDWSEYDGGPSFVDAPLEVYRLGAVSDRFQPNPDAGLIEVPVSTGYLRLPVSTWRAVSRRLQGRTWKRLRVPGIAARLGITRRLLLSPELNSSGALISLAKSLIEGGIGHLHLFFHSSSLRPGLTPFTRSPRDCDMLIQRIERFVDGIARFAEFDPQTVSALARDVLRDAQVPDGHGAFSLEREEVATAPGLTQGGARTHIPVDKVSTEPVESVVGATRETEGIGDTLQLPGAGYPAANWFWVVNPPGRESVLFVGPDNSELAAALGPPFDEIATVQATGVERDGALALPAGSMAFDMVVVHQIPWEPGRILTHRAAHSLALECKRVLKPAGCVLVGGPNAWWKMERVVGPDRTRRSPVLRVSARRLHRAFRSAGFRGHCLYVDQDMALPFTILPATRAAAVALESTQREGGMRHVIRRGLAAIGLHRILYPTVVLVAYR